MTIAEEKNIEKNISHHLKKHDPIPRSKRNKGKTGIMF